MKFLFGISASIDSIKYVFVRKHLVLLFCISLIQHLKSQQDTFYLLVNSYKKVDSLLLARDTNGVISKLDNMINSFQGSSCNIFSYSLQAKLLWAQNKKEAAKDKVYLGLSYTDSKHVGSISQYALRTFSLPDGKRFKSELSLLMSEFYLGTKQYDSALHYIYLADTVYYPRYDCANGSYGYKAWLTRHYIKCYLASGDTSLAMNKLLNYFINYEADQEYLTSELKKILYLKYDKEEIRAELNKGINNLRFKKEQIELSAFNQTFNVPFYGAKTKNDAKRILKANKYIIRLMND